MSRAPRSVAASVSLAACAVLLLSSPLRAEGDWHSQLDAALGCEVAPGCDYGPACDGVDGTPFRRSTDDPALPPPVVSPQPQPEATAAAFQTLASRDRAPAMIGGPGYIDMAIPISRFRLRYDSMYGNDSPDRAEFIYPQCGCFGRGAPGPGVPGVSGNGEIDFQEVVPYVEWAANPDFSVFADLPVRFLNPTAGEGPLLETGNTAGLGDMTAGFKYALYRDDIDYLTLQFKTYIPTGDGDKGLGTDHVSLEPGLLFFNQVDDRLSFFGELRYWIPINGSELNGQDFAGDVLRYGLGSGYTVHDTCDWSLTPIAEFVAWSVFDGLSTNLDRPTGVESAETTIANFKIGTRAFFKNETPSSLYVGYGRGLTGNVWYRDIVRVEYEVYY